MFFDISNITSENEVISIKNSQQETECYDDPCPDNEPYFYYSDVIFNPETKWISGSFEFYDDNDVTVTGGFSTQLYELIKK